MSDLSNPSDPTYTPPTPPDPNAGWSNVHNPIPGTPVPPAGSYQAGQYPPPGQYPPSGQYPPAGYVPAPAGAGLASNVAAAISYITFIPAVIFLVLEPYKNDPFVRFHAWQEIALTLTSIVIGIAFHFLGFLGFAIHSLINLVLFVFWVIAIAKAFGNQRWKIPLIGDLAESLSGSIKL